MLTRKAAKMPDRLAIENDVVYPERLPRIADRYEFSKLEVGQSFLIPYPPNHERRTRKWMQMKCGSIIGEAHRQLPARRFSQRSYPDGVRVWRIR